MKMIKIEEEEKKSFDYEEAIKEVEILRKIQHPNIVSIKESFAYFNYLCIIMEYAPGIYIYIYLYIYIYIKYIYTRGRLISFIPISEVTRI